MSTRSGKRIHSTVFDDTDTECSEAVAKSAKKTRLTRRLKGTDDHKDSKIPKPRKQKKNYVSYPTDDEGGYTTATDIVDDCKSRKSKKIVLKEQDINVLDKNNAEAHVETKQVVRVTRQTKKFTDNGEGYTQNVELASQIPSLNGKVKGKKNKKNKSRTSDENIAKPVNEVENISKKCKSKKKVKQNAINEDQQTLNASYVSSDSFHSAAGSPEAIETDMGIDDLVADELDVTVVKQNETTLSNSSEKVCKQTIMSIRKTLTPEKEMDDQAIQNSFIKIRKSLSDKEEITNKTNLSSKFNDKELSMSKELNSTYDIAESDQSSPILGLESKAKRSLSISNSTKESTTVFGNGDKVTMIKKSLSPNKSLVENFNNELNADFEKNTDESKGVSLNSTFDKPAKLDTTFDKTEPKINSGKSSIISSDEGTINVTFDKNNSAISITSDESKENIVNTTPLLIESSIDESHHSLKLSKNFEASVEKLEKAAQITAPTPLKREGTFTKESPEIQVKTPTRRQTLPSPGFTPFHVTSSSNKKKSELNVTRSLEKSRRSSLADIAPTRQTRVMFCSPMDNPAMVMQQRKKVIKSSMKGSNKSFVFEDAAARPLPRKRSLTHEAGASRAKRSRLAEDLQLSVDRLSRPRTSSATAKLSVTPKKQTTPAKPKTDPKRTKLPNFAALHQKQFDKMESLTDCQQRKLRRARKMLVPKTPNVNIMVLERSSPKGQVEQAKPKEGAASKKSATPVKPDTASKKTELASKKLLTLESLRPGFTRFGFKMNIENNPFSVPSKDTKPKAIEKNLTEKVSAPKTLSLGSRQPTLPSLNGVATSRKDVARQTVMREKSFTALSKKRDAKRNESRTIIKGVRTNRRFELQMKMRNVD